LELLELELLELELLELELLELELLELELLELELLELELLWELVSNSVNFSIFDINAINNNIIISKHTVFFILFNYIIY